MTELTHATGLLGALSAHLAPLEGECQEHGPATMLTRVGLAWRCPKCMDAAKRADFEQQSIAERRAHLHDIAEIPLRYRGQKFVGHTPEQKAVRAQALAFREFIVTDQRWAALVLTGEAGTGKTQLACEFAERMIEKYGRSVRYVTAKGMISEIQSCYGREGKSEATEIDRFVQYDLLILDEADAIADKDNAKLLLTEIINRRYSNERPMIVISNQTLAGLVDFVGDRICDRLRENAFICSFNWPSFRHGEQRENLDRREAERRKSEREKV